MVQFAVVIANIISIGVESVLNVLIGELLTRPRRSKIFSRVSAIRLASVERTAIGRYFLCKSWVCYFVTTIIEQAGDMCFVVCQHYPPSPSCIHIGHQKFLGNKMPHEAGCTIESQPKSSHRLHETCYFKWPKDAQSRGRRHRH